MQTQVTLSSGYNTGGGYSVGSQLSYVSMNEWEGGNTDDDTDPVVAAVNVESMIICTHISN